MIKGFKPYESINLLGNDYEKEYLSYCKKYEGIDDINLKRLAAKENRIKVKEIVNDYVKGKITEEELKTLIDKINNLILLGERIDEAHQNIDDNLELVHNIICRKYYEENYQNDMNYQQSIIEDYKQEMLNYEEENISFKETILSLCIEYEENYSEKESTRMIKRLKELAEDTIDNKMKELKADIFEINGIKNKLSEFSLREIKLLYEYEELFNDLVMYKNDTLERIKKVYSQRFYEKVRDFLEKKVDSILNSKYNGANFSSNIKNSEVNGRKRMR